MRDGLRALEDPPQNTRRTRPRPARAPMGCCGRVRKEEVESEAKGTFGKAGEKEQKKQTILAANARSKQTHRDVATAGPTLSVREQRRLNAAARRNNESTQIADLDQFGNPVYESSRGSSFSDRLSASVSRVSGGRLSRRQPIGAAEEGLLGQSREEDRRPAGLGSIQAKIALSGPSLRGDFSADRQDRRKMIDAEKTDVTI